MCSTNIVTSQAPSNGCQYDISLQASIDGLPSDPFQMTVNTPSYLEAAGAPSDAAWMGAGFQSTMPYYVRDHCGNVMSSIAVNEEFNAFFPDTSNDWPKPTPINVSGFSGGFSDVIGIWGSYSPQPLIPQSPLTSTKVDHATQYFRIGSATTGSGVLVKTTTHQKYLDHGRHEP